MMRYAIIDASGNIVNVAVWDGVGEWQPPAGCLALQDPDGKAAPGGTHDGKDFHPPIVPDSVPATPSLLDRLQALETKIAAAEAAGKI